MSLDSWSEYTGKQWLNAADVQGEEQPFVVVDVTEDEEDKRPVLNLQNGSLTAMFGVNVTNANKLKEFAPSPKGLIGKKIYFRKVMVTSPKTKKEVETLRISKVE
jgi:hypothetical protein